MSNQSCPDCLGSGWIAARVAEDVAEQRPCETCHGTGKDIQKTPESPETSTNSPESIHNSESFEAVVGSYVKPIQPIRGEVAIDAILAAHQIAVEQAEQVMHNHMLDYCKKTCDFLVREARIDELGRVLDNIHEGTLEPALRDRIKALQERKES